MLVSIAVWWNAAWRSQSLTTALRPSAVAVCALRERRCGFDAGEHLSVVLGCLAQSVSGNGANLWRRLFGRRRACSLRAALASRLACITDVPRRGAAKPQGRKRKPVGGPGRRKVAFSALASLGGAFGSSTTSTCSAALLLTLASGASTSQPWGLAPPGMLGAAAAGTACDRSGSAATGGWLPVGSRASVASFDATFPPAAARGLTSSGGQAR